MHQMTRNFTNILKIIITISFSFSFSYKQQAKRTDIWPLRPALCTDWQSPGHDILSFFRQMTNVSISRHQPWSCRTHPWAASYSLHEFLLPSFQRVKYRLIFRTSGLENGAVTLPWAFFLTSFLHCGDSTNSTGFSQCTTVLCGSWDPRQ